MQLAVALLCVLTSQASDKIDPPLANATTARPVFVRMEAQLFKKIGDFEAFCKANETTPRSKLRKSVLATLHANADKSWAGIKTFVEEQEPKSDITNVRRFWIVNGFACDATPTAVKALAARPDVSFVYLQIANGRQQDTRKETPEEIKTKQTAMQAGIAAYKDDSATPFSTDGVEIPWDLKQIQADQVWKQGATGQGTIVAINDQGIFDIPALQSALWRNTKEKIDGKDDDGNGYVDDIFGWDSATDSGDVLGNGGVSHGTICSGIVAGRPTSEKKYVTGVAPRTRIMLINGMGRLNGFEYALTNGADVFSMSYMVVNPNLGNYRGILRLAADQATAAGMLLCGGAGNFARTAPEGHQITIPKDIPSVLCAAGCAEDGSRPVFSSKGPVSWSGVKFYDDPPTSRAIRKPDVAAPATGFLCWGLEGQTRPAWKILFTGSQKDVLVSGPQGNSFAGPHAAGVAALMFSANRDINPWQVKRIITETCKDTGEPGWDPLQGYGIIQALPAVQRAKSLKFTQD